MADWTVGADRNLPINTGRAWDGAAAAASVWEWAGFNGDNPNPAKARKAFLVYDRGAPELKGSYKLGFAQVIGGKLTALATGLRASASRLPQADIPQATKDRARKVLDAYFERINQMSMGAEMQYKSIRTEIKELHDRTAIGIAAVHGNVDDGGDRSWPGSFNTTVDGRMRTRFLWMHNANEPPTAQINYIRELTRPELPAKTLDYAPDATGGVEVSRTYLDTPRGNEILAALLAGAIDEMSYAYQPTVYDFEESNGQTIRNLRQMDIYDISDVTWGMNPATSAIKGLDWEVMPVSAHADALEGAIRAYADRLAELKERRAKAGRTFSQANTDRIASIADAMAEAASDLHKMLDSAKPSEEHAREIRRLFLDSQRTLAQLNGVRL